MCRVPFLVLVCISVLTDAAAAHCTTTKHEEGFGERVICSNASLDAVTSHDRSVLVGEIMVFQSRIEFIRDRAFVRYGRSLHSLTMNDCGIKRIADNAFDGLSSLEKLGLPYNNITTVREHWFLGLTSLKQLDLSYNRIESIGLAVFEKLRGLKRLDVRENRLTCLEPTQLVPITGLEKLRFSGNPFTFRCRGTLTLWLHDLGVNYKTELRGEEDWLDSLLWLCAADDGDVANSEVLMKECVVLHLFNQLRTGLTTAESYPVAVSQECADARDELTRCLHTSYKRNEKLKNGHAVRKLLRLLEQAKSTL